MAREPIATEALRARHTSNPPHQADGMTAHVQCGDGAVMTIVDPLADPHPEWVQRYGNVEPIRYAVASILESYDYLLSSEINMTEATRRLRLLRAARTALSTTAPRPSPADGGT